MINIISAPSTQGYFQTFQLLDMYSCFLHWGGGGTPSCPLSMPIRQKDGHHFHHLSVEIKKKLFKIEKSKLYNIYS